MDYKIRVFISYSRKDKEFVKELVTYLKEKCNINVIWDDDLSAGSGFHEQLKDFIASAHIFMPLITKESSERGWVHQEIGYAMALNIPVLPVTTENIEPGGMLNIIHAVKIDSKIENLELFLNKKTFEITLKNASATPIFLCAHLPEERTKMITDYSNKISNIGEYGIVRQKGGLSSFHIPQDNVLRPIWNERYFPEHKSEYHKRLQRDERLALEIHAKERGYKLIINPEYAIKDRHPKSSIARLETLINFLNDPNYNPAVVAIQNTDSLRKSLTIVGDWFVAESVSFSEGDGFTNTFFTKDCFEIERRIEDFECELLDLIEQRGWTLENSRENAIEELNKLLLKFKTF